MSNPRIININLWRSGTPSYSSQHPAFPAINVQIDSPTIAWRSRYGTGSGNGLFTITASANDRIDFDEGGAELVATLTAGTYNGTTLAAEVKTQMDAAGGTYTVSYSESTGKFTIARGAGNFTLRWNTGTDVARSAAATLGFATAANDTGAATYTSDYARYHYPSEYLVVDLGAASAYNYIGVLNHNLSATATLTLYGADDAAFTTNVVSDAVTYNAANIHFFLTATRTKRYLKLAISDPDNPAGYASVGLLFCGYSFDLDQPAQIPDDDGYADQGSVVLSDSGVAFATQRSRLRFQTFPVKGLGATAAGNVRDIGLYNGLTIPWVLCFDTTTPNGNSYLVYSAADIVVKRVGKNTFETNFQVREAK